MFKSLFLPPTNRINYWKSLQNDFGPIALPIIREVRAKKGNGSTKNINRCKTISDL
jgi:hypothetical protein